MRKILNRSTLAQAALTCLATFGLFNADSTDAIAQPAIAAPIANWSYIHHSSTATEGALRGQAEVISAAATYRYMDSLSVVNYQEAYRRAIENRHAQVQRYFEERAIVLEFREKYWPKAFVGEPRRRAMEQATPKRLTASQFNVHTGVLKWPYELNDVKYQDARFVIDRYFARRNDQDRGWGTECEVEVTRLCKAMEKLVFDRACDLTPDQKIYTSNFLLSVIRESQTPVSGGAEIDRDDLGAE
jgi:hypothetical protein